MDHLGTCKTKSVDRSSIWWPKFYKEIERVGHSCESCMSMSNDPRVVNSHHSLPISRPYQPTQVDYAGLIEGGNMLLVLMDSFYK